MRLDKWLQLSRLVRRREDTRELCAAGRVVLRGTPAKPAREVTAGDVVTLNLWRRLVEVRVLSVPAGNVSRKDAPGLYEVIVERAVEEGPPGH
jgi:ribosomal 50S subunit-recycling heat shock protein